MTGALLDLPLHLRRRLQAALGAGFLAAPFTAASLQAALGDNRPRPELAEALEVWEELGVPGPAKAAWLASLEAAEARRAAPEFVWSGQKVRGIPSRGTRDALELALRGARRSVWLSTYVFFDGKRAFELLAERMDAVPELQVTLLLNIERKRGDTTAADDLVRRFATRLWGVEWPGTRRPRVFYDPRAVEAGGASGVLHAKALVVDEERVLVTSANLTDRALDENIEIGVLLRDRALAQTAVAHFRALIEAKRLRALPAA